MQVRKDTVLSDRGAAVKFGGLLFAAVTAYHVATAWIGGPASNWYGKTSEYYPLLTDAYLAGQTSLLVKPSPELLALPDPYDHIANAKYRLHDASLYHGKYYLFYGPTPVLVLFLPYKLLTGVHLQTRVAVALFCIIGFACSSVLFFLLAKREKWDCPPWFALAAVLSLGTAPAVSVLLSRPSFYEVTISAAYACVMAGFLFSLRALGEERPPCGSLVWAGLCFGLAAGCRPNFALIAILMAILVAFRLRSDRVRASAFVGPIVLCGILLAIYNYIRFENPFEFGIQYQLFDSTREVTNLFARSASSFFPTLAVLIFSPGQIAGPEIATGLLRWSPILFTGLLAPCILRFGSGKDHVNLSATRFVIYGMYLSSLCILILMALLGYVNRRYVMDFAPGFALLSWCLLAAMWQGIRSFAKSRQLPFQIAVVGAALYSGTIDVCVCLARIPR
jgi:hypothetical protein